MNVRERARQYYQGNKEKVKQQSREYYRLNRASILARMRARYYLLNNYPELGGRNLLSLGELSEHQRGGHRKRRLELINRMGGKCIRCGFDDWRALQVDHINGGGAKDRCKTASPLVYLKKIEENKADYQLLCANCNWIKKYENEESAQKRID